MDKSKKQRKRLNSENYRTLNAALQLASAGYKVFPIHGVTDGKCNCGNVNCTSIGKHPLTKRGVYDATSDNLSVKRLFLGHAKPNIAIATGHEAGLVVLDVDARKHGSTTIKKLARDLGKLPKGPVVMTGDGYHRYFRAPAELIRRDTAGKVFGPGVDVIGEGSYVIAPPSAHANGSTYQWSEDRNVLQGVVVPKLPKAWLDVLIAGSAVHNPAAPAPSNGNSKIGDGTRNQELTKIAGGLVRNGIVGNELSVALQAINVARCEPPLDENEVKRVAESVSRYSVGNGGDQPLEQELKVYLAVKAKLEACGEKLAYVPGQGFQKYSGGAWTTVKDKVIEKLVLADVMEIPPDQRGKATALTADVCRLMMMDLTTDIDPFKAKKPRAIINCLNGEVHLGDDGKPELRPHSPASNLTSILPVDYDPLATSPVFDRAMTAIMGETSDPKAMVKFLNEVMGYAIQPVRDQAVILLLLGGGNNGKTEFMRTVLSLIGTDFVYSGKLEDLEKNRFAFGHLRGKLVFYDDDIRSGAKLPDGILKKISEDKLLTGEIKNRDPFQFINTAVPILAANNEPTTSDLSHGLRRRMIVIPFDHTFVDGVDLDRTLWPEIRATEMSGILNRAITGLVRLRKRGSFKRPADVIRATDKWLQHANPLKAFLDERTHLKAGAKTPISAVYGSYSTWASGSGITYHLQRNTLARQLRQLGYNIGNTSDGSVVVGMALKK